MSNSDSPPPSLGFPAAPPSPSHKPTNFFGESFDESEFEARMAKSRRATRLALIDMKKMNHRAKKVLGLTNSESQLSVVPESVFWDSGSETFQEAQSGEGTRGEEMKAMEAGEDGKGVGETDPEFSKGVGEAEPEFSKENWDDYVKGLPAFTLEMYQIVLPKFFPRN